MYAKFFKRFFDLTLSLLALTVLSPVLLILMITGTVAMKGNPFFTQDRPGRNEKIFKMIKFRTMSNARDKNGRLLPDDIRLNKYGRLLRSTSLDELPELFNILLGQMALVGPRPLLVRYLPYYRPEERHRHDVRPGLTGLAQVHGRNLVGWDERFRMDVKYARNITLMQDVSIILLTVRKVLCRQDIVMGNQHKLQSLDVERGELQNEDKKAST